MTRLKPLACHRSIIIDLSYPPRAPVNAGVSPDSYLYSEFLLTLVAIDNITGKIRGMGKGSNPNTKFDISLPLS